MKSRRSIHLAGCDYRLAGYYMVTIRCDRMAPALAAIEEGVIEPTAIGRIVRRVWDELPQHFSLELDAFVVMPDHIHGIVRLHVTDAEQSDVQHIRGTPAHSLNSIIQSFKSITTRRANVIERTPGRSLWQRNYYDSLILTARRLLIARHYIADNPKRWISEHG